MVSNPAPSSGESGNLTCSLIRRFDPKKTSGEGAVSGGVEWSVVG